MNNKFTYQGFMCQDAQRFFEGYTIQEERQGCATIGTFIKLADGNTWLPCKNDTFIKDDKGIHILYQK